MKAANKNFWQVSITEAEKIQAVDFALGQEILHKNFLRILKHTNEFTVFYI